MRPPSSLAMPAMTSNMRRTRRTSTTDRTAGNNDQRHRFVLSGVYSTDGLARRTSTVSARALIGGWSFSAIFTAQSGQPYTARVGAVDLNGDGNTRNDIAPGTVRNQFRLPAIVTLDPRIARDIRIGAVPRTADLGSVQSAEPRQHQRCRRDLLQRRRHHVDPQRNIRPSTGKLRRTDHAARAEGDVLKADSWGATCCPEWVLRATRGTTTPFRPTLIAGRRPIAFSKRSQRAARSRCRSRISSGAITTAA